MAKLTRHERKLRKIHNQATAVSIELITITVASGMDEAILLDHLRSVARELKTDTCNHLRLPFEMGSPQQKRITRVWTPASTRKEDIFFFEFAPALVPATAPPAESAAPAAEPVVEAAPVVEVSTAPATPSTPKRHKRRGKKDGNGSTDTTVCGQPRSHIGNFYATTEKPKATEDSEPKSKKPGTKPIKNLKHFGQFLKVEDDKLGGVGAKLAAALKAHAKAKRADAHA